MEAVKCRVSEMSARFVARLRTIGDEGMSDRNLKAGDDCLCKAMPGVTHLTVRGATIGMAGLRELFLGWKEANRSPDDLTDQAILQGIRARNYVPEPVEADYIAAVRGLYAARR
jgi:hypothetical protein